jgi:hypothetical protein
LIFNTFSNLAEAKRFYVRGAAKDEINRYGMNVGRKGISIEKVPS